MNLYMISLGGKVKGCNIEAHDVQFVAAQHIDETIEVLKSSWYGQAEKLHMDSYKVIHGADGYSVNLTKQKPASDKQLYFVHFGGYRENSTQEQHEIGFFVGNSDTEVKERANKEYQVADIQNHVDSLVAVERVILSTDQETYYIELKKSMEEFDCAPDWFGYRRLDQE
jgi:hypothetical protein